MQLSFQCLFGIVLLCCHAKQCNIATNCNICFICDTDDLWVISQELTFDPGCTFVAKSIYHGPSSSNELEIEPVSSYSPSNWPSNSK